MPSLRLTTNVKVCDVKALILELSKLGAETLGKPELFITVDFRHNETLTFNGSFEPAFNLFITSFDNINRTANEGYSKIFFKYLEERLGVTGTRGYVIYVDAGRENVSYDGRTFATIMGDE